MATRTDRFWDCECVDNYIRSDKEHQCSRCGATQDEQPYSLVEEVAPLIHEELAILNELLKMDGFGIEELKRRDALEDVLSDLEACYVS